MSIRIQKSKCAGCGRCIEACPGNLIKKDKENKAFIRQVRDCWGCTSCIKECRHDAIRFFLGADVGGNQLYAVKARAESSLNNTIQSATAEYKALPAAKQTKSRKIAIVMGKASELKAMEASCDKEVDDIVNQMRALLTQNGQSTALADEALAAYKAQKSEMVSSLTSKLYG